MSSALKYDVPAPQWTTSEEDEIPRFEVTPYRDPTLSLTFTFRFMGALCLLFSAVDMGIGIVIGEYTSSAGAFWSGFCGILAGTLVANFECDQIYLHSNFRFG
jgi:hypothetical protein